MHTSSGYAWSAAKRRRRGSRGLTPAQQSARDPPQWAGWRAVCQRPFQRDLGAAWPPAPRSVTGLTLRSKPHLPSHPCTVTAFEQKHQRAACPKQADSCAALPWNSADAGMKVRRWRRSVTMVVSRLSNRLGAPVACLGNGWCDGDLCAPGWISAWCMCAWWIIGW